MEIQMLGLRYTSTQGIFNSFSNPIFAYLASTHSSVIQSTSLRGFRGVQSRHHAIIVFGVVFSLHSLPKRLDPMVISRHWDGHINSKDR